MMQELLVIDVTTKGVHNTGQENDILVCVGCSHSLGERDLIIRTY